MHHKSHTLSLTHAVMMTDMHGGGKTHTLAFCVIVRSHNCCNVSYGRNGRRRQRQRQRDGFFE
jgi:hypothetical protein